MNLALVEQIVQAALGRLDGEHDRARAIVDFAARCARVAELYERERRWWEVLVRHGVGYSPYLRAVLGARELCRTRAQAYREYTARAGQRAA